MKNHYHQDITIAAPAHDIFDFIDNHHNLSSHMSGTSWMMFGSKMETHIDEGQGQKIGSHIIMKGSILGIPIFLDEIITKREPPLTKIWQTVGTVRLLVIGHYQMGVYLTPTDKQTNVRIFIDYDHPRGISKIFGILLGSLYAKWCVSQMIQTLRHEYSAKA